MQRKSKNSRYNMEEPQMQTANSRFSLCSYSSLLMAVLFALSASFQFNDPDWYFWFPLYAMACLVNMVNGFTKIAKIAVWMGIILFLKVVTEDLCFHQGIAGLWSFDMRERVVREKLGSGLVILSMFLQLQNSNTNNPVLANHVEFGKSMLVAVGYGLSFAFFLFSKPEIKF